MEEFFGLVLGVGGEVDAQFSHDVGVDLGQNDGRMSFAGLQIFELFNGLCGGRIFLGRDDKGNQYLVSMETGVKVAKVLGFKLLDGQNDLRGNEMHLIGDIGKSFESVQQHGRSRPKEIGGFACNDSAVVEFKGGCRLAAVLVGFGFGGGNDFTAEDRDA